jgi:hypothetical protein
MAKIMILPGVSSRRINPAPRAIALIHVPGPRSLHHDEPVRRQRRSLLLTHEVDFGVAKRYETLISARFTLIA